MGLATCSSLPEWEVDDAPLHEALQRRGIVIERPAWDDPTFNWSGVAACVLRTTWDYVPRIEAFRRWLPQVAAATRLWNPLPIVLWNLDKRYLRDLADAGVPTIPTWWVESPTGVRGGGWMTWLREQVESGLSSVGAARGFIKPAVGATASGTLRFQLDDAGMAMAAMHLEEAMRDGGAPASPAMLIQPYLPEVERHGEVSFIFIDGRFTHAVRKVPVPGDYRVQDDWGGRDERWQPDGEQVRLAGNAIAAALRVVEDRMSGEGGGAGACGADALHSADELLYARADFLRDGNGRLLLTELELVEPSLFFRHGHHAADALADAIARRL